MSSVRQRKKGSTNRKKGKSKKQIANKSSNVTPKSSRLVTKARPLIPLPLIFRLFIASMFIFAIYIFKQYYVPKKNPKVSITNNQTQIIDIADVDFTTIINSEDIDLSNDKLKEISPRFSAKKTKKVPPLRLWNIQDLLIAKDSLKSKQRVCLVDI